MAEDRGLHSGSAHLVDGRCADAIGEPGASRRLARGRLTLPCRKYTSHDDFVHMILGEPGAVETGAQCRRAKLRRGNGGQGALKSAERSANGGHDDDGIGMRHGTQPFDIMRERPLTWACHEGGDYAPSCQSPDTGARGAAAAKAMHFSPTDGVTAFDSAGRDG